MGIKAVLAAVTVVLVFSGCATSTSPGAVGVGRTQLLMVPSAAVNEAAALNYIKQTGTATTSGKLNSIRSWQRGSSQLQSESSKK